MLSICWARVGNDISSSEYLREIHRKKYSPCPHFDMTEEVKLQQIVHLCIAKATIKSAHDVSDGGVFSCLVESAMPRGLGFVVQSNKNIRTDAWLFGESQSRVIVTVDTKRQAEFDAYLSVEKIAYEKLGIVHGKQIVIDDVSYGQLSAWAKVFDTQLGKLF